MGLPRLVGGDAGAGRGRLLARSRSPAATKGKRHPVAVACMGGGRGVRGWCASGWKARPASARGRARPATRSGSWSGPGRGCAHDPAAAQIEAGPQASGVFADFDRHGGGCELQGLDEDGQAGAGVRRPAPGLVAATRRYEAPPTWVVTGADADGRARPPPACSTPPTCATITRWQPRAGRRRRCRPGRDEIALRLHAEAGPAPGGLAGGGGRLPRLAGGGRLHLLEPAGPRRRPASRRRSPACSPAPRDAVRAALRMGLTLALLIVVVNALVVSRGETVLARLGDWPLLGQVDVTAEALADGLVLGLRAAVVDGRLRRLLGLRRPRPGAARPAADRGPLGADRDPRLPPRPGRRGRRRPPARRRPAARARAPPRSAAASLARRLLAGSLDRAVDVAATLELRGYGLDAPRAARRRGALPLRRPLLRDRRRRPRRRDRRQAARRRRLQRLPDDRAGHRPTNARALGPRRSQRPGAAAPKPRRIVSRTG